METCSKQKTHMFQMVYLGHDVHADTIAGAVHGTLSLRLCCEPRHRKQTQRKSRARAAQVRAAQDREAAQAGGNMVL